MTRFDHPEHGVFHNRYTSRRAMLTNAAALTNPVHFKASGCEWNQI
jgi:hypothetical protein